MITVASLWSLSTTQRSGPACATLKHFLGRSWTPDLADTWAQAYGLVAKVMVAAAEQHEELRQPPGRQMWCRSSGARSRLR